MPLAWRGRESLVLTRAGSETPPPVSLSQRQRAEPVCAARHIKTSYWYFGWRRLIREELERRGDVRTRFSRYSDGAYLSPRDGRQLAERVAQSGPTFSLESSGGLIEGMFCGPTYLIV